jgi:hypothetical protein
MLHLTLPSFGQYESPNSGDGQFINQRILYSLTMLHTLSSMDEHLIFDDGMTTPSQNLTYQLTVMWYHNPNKNLYFKY